MAAQKPSNKAPLSRQQQLDADIEALHEQAKRTISGSKDQLKRSKSLLDETDPTTDETNGTTGCD